ncbi:MAG TPA: MATE family efflux transporter [Gemmatimonadaceae bacterium]|nr:MATE family efflux transporter [Gemmatimonadaceae bacterium]
MGKALRIPTKSEVRDVARLAGPIVVVQVGLMLMGVVDAAIVGRYSAQGLAAVALGNVYFNSIVTLGHGTLMALDPLVSQAVGARDQPAIERALQRGLVLCVALSIPLALLLLPGELFFTPLRQPDDVVPLAAAYARACIPGVLPYLAFIALRQTVQAFSLVRPVVVAVVVANIANVFLDWGMVFGKFGFPAMGPVGSGWATTICRWLMALLLLWGCRHALVPFLRHWSREDLAPAPLWRMMRIGFPIGLQLWIEFTAFSVALLLVGLLGTLPLAGHQIALMLAALTYMVPLGVSAAAAVLVGHAVGRGDLEAARREASAALACGVGFMSVTALVLIGFAPWLARVFTADPGILAVASVLIPIAGVFQVFDGIQGVSSGILRGAGDTRVPMWANLAGYFAVGLPLGAWLGLSSGWGPQGIWWGLVAGLASVAALLGWRVHVIIGGELQRLQG